MDHKLIFEQTRKELDSAFRNNSETELSKILKKNTFLFYYFYSRKKNVCPTFSEVSFGDNLRCDFAWLNDSSDGPEWILMELKEPKLPLFLKSGKPSAKLLQAIDQVASWNRYFTSHPNEKGRIFGAVSRFRFILVAGSRNEWQAEHSARWRLNHNNNSQIEIRSSTRFWDALDELEKSPNLIQDFTRHGSCLGHCDLPNFWSNYNYMDKWRKIL